MTKAEYDVASDWFSRPYETYCQANQSCAGEDPEYDAHAISNTQTLCLKRRTGASLPADDPPKVGRSVTNLWLVCQKLVRRIDVSRKSQLELGLVLFFLGPNRTVRFASHSLAILREAAESLSPRSTLSQSPWRRGILEKSEITGQPGHRWLHDKMNE